MLIRHITLLVLISVCAACNAPSTAPKPAQAPSPDTSTKELVVATNLGDVEQQIWIDALLSNRSRSATVTEEGFKDARGKTNLLNVTVAPPYPNELWLDISVRPRRAFPNTPVVLRGSYTITAECVDQTEPVKITKPLFQLKVGKKIQNFLPGGSINVLQDLPGAPKSILAQVTVEALLMPDGTDENTLDVATASTSPERQGTLTSNPVRLGFGG